MRRRLRDRFVRHVRQINKQTNLCSMMLLLLVILLTVTDVCWLLVQRRIVQLREKRAAKEEKERYEKLAAKMHKKRVERLKRKEKRNKLLNS